MTLAWLLVQLVGYCAAFALVLAAVVAAIVLPPYLLAHFVRQWWVTR